MDLFSNLKGIIYNYSVLKARKFITKALLYLGTRDTDALLLTKVSINLEDIINILIEQ